jgi:rhodanese-related sulfurtransferase
MNIKLINILFIPFMLMSCLDEFDPNANLTELGNTAELLNYLETCEDFINSNKNPSLITVDEVYNNIQNYLLIDIRASEDFSAGHISESINLTPQQLPVLFDTLNYSAYEKIVLISLTGEASSYYNCLLRLLGYNNTYSMKFGLTYWNEIYSSIRINSEYWTEVNYSWEFLSGAYFNFNDTTYQHGKINHLPSLNFSSNNLSIEEKLKERILPLFNLVFVEKEVKRGTPFDNLYDDTKVSLTFESLYQNYNKHSNSFDDIYLMYYGPYRMYRPLDYPKGFVGILPCHPPAAVWYNSAPFSDIKSVNNLQTIPATNLITVCSTSGIESAYITAYLNVLGYNAKSILFGASFFQYDSLLARPTLSEKMFKIEEVRNYPIVSGNMMENNFIKPINERKHL